MSEAKTKEESHNSSWQVAWRQLRKDRLSMLGGALILLLSGIAVFAPLLANGRPLYIRGYLTQVYDSDAAAFGDWHRLLADTVLQLRAGVPARERPLYEGRLQRYQEGLPKILDRLSGAIPAAKRRELKELRRAYRPLLRASVTDLDLAEYDRVGAAIEEKVCALSLSAAYKRAAGPLLGVAALIEEARLAREDPKEAGRVAVAAAQAAALAAKTQAGVQNVLLFLTAGDRRRLNAAEGESRAALEALALPTTDLGAVDEATVALADLLDELADAPVSVGSQQLDVVTHWPVFRSLTALEIAFMVLYVCIILQLVLAKRITGFGPTLWSIGVPPLAAGLLWLAFLPPVALPSESLYKNLVRQQELQPDDGVSATVFPIVPFGENENIHADRVTAPALWERFGPKEQRKSLANRLQVEGAPVILPAQALDHLTRLRSHWLGTDDNGRDILARLIYGSRVSLSVGFVAVGIYVLIGLIVGSIAGYFGGWVDVILMRITELVMCFPSFFLIITVMSIIEKPRIEYIMIVIGITRWTEVMRLVRGEFLRLRSQDFVTAAVALGLPPLRVVFRHVLPNAVGPVFVAATFGVAGAILIESALSFLGFGVPQPTASWGSVLNVAFGHEKQMWWITIFAGALIFVTVTAYNLVGEGLRDALDPKLRQ